MKIIIPMSGIGNRFLERGYNTPKPLIEIEGKPIIEHIVAQFNKDEDEFIFICNENHLKKTHLNKVLTNICTNFKIYSIPEHKLGPVHSVLEIEQFIVDDEPYIVNYCDFSWRWDYQRFILHTKQTECEGSVIGYKGFHPHLLVPDNLYASMKVDQLNQLEEIKEKFSFTENKMDCYQSSGTYYFRKGSHIKKYFQQLIDKKILINNEFYVSMVFEEMRKDQKLISVYEIPTFLQWGTPDDLEDYLYWSNYFNRTEKNLDSLEIENLSALIPMAGRGERFSKAGYNTPKPLIKVDNGPMVSFAANSLPKAAHYYFVCQNEHLDQLTVLKNNYQSSEIIPINFTTEGQAATCLLAKEQIDPASPLIIGACDNGMTWDQNHFSEKQKKFDALIFTFKNHPALARNPEMYGWVNINEFGQALGVSCKKSISDNPSKDHAIVGSFYFNQAKIYFDAAEKLIKQDRRIKNEFYIDEVMNVLIEDGYKVGVFEIDYYLGFGTPADLETFQYWKKFFSEHQQ